MKDTGCVQDKLFTSILWKIEENKAGHGSNAYLEVNGKSLQNIYIYMFEKSLPKKWKTHLLPGKLSFDPGPASLARDLDVMCGNLFPMSELEMASGMLYVISLLKNLIGFSVIMHGILSLESGAFYKVSTTSVSRLFFHCSSLLFLKLNIIGSSRLGSLVKQISIHVECHPFFPSPPTKLLTILLLFLNKGLDSS